MDSSVRERIEGRLTELPIIQYEFFDISELTFSERVRYICETECPQYGRSWACPPAVGTVAACRERCFSYEEGFLFASVSQVRDIADLEETLSTREGHEKLTHQVKGIFQKEGFEVMALSTESCAICEMCSYPDSPCRHPDKMFPCVESYGILVTDLAEKYGIEFIQGSQIVTWFSLLFLKKTGEDVTKE
ncbi:MAG TPA: DUF2284 domain-containing protein [Firmicutes bacterium]|nr:DUF2284 domain-containing protein [Bacillota bacterium]